MSNARSLYRHSLALLTDLYQLTMAHGYWKLGRADDEAVFHLFFRENPFGGGFAVAAGLETAIHFLDALRFDAEDVDYLSALKGNDGKRLFDAGFLDYLRALRPACDVDAIPEGTAVFPHEPLVRVRGPLLECQILETALLNIINFQTLVATKAARICAAAGGEPVLEFGLRRAQGIDGGLAASRAAYIGGCAATSNVLAGKLFGIPVKGTHAHSWVMCFDDEEEAFEEYARAMPNNCVFLVDTYDTIDGVRRAIEVARRLRQSGHEMLGVRLDSGDLAELSIEARRLLDEAGFPDAGIVASNDLDEERIVRLKESGARVGVWGVGTRLATAHDQPALGGVYKLAAIRRPGTPWQYKVKLSEQPAKVSTPGVLQVRRYRDGDSFVADMIFDEGPLAGPDFNAAVTIVDPTGSAGERSIPEGAAFDDLLAPVFRAGSSVYAIPDIDVSRRRTSEQLAALPDGVRRLSRADTYTVGIEKTLHDLRNRLIVEAGGVADTGAS